MPIQLAPDFTILECEVELAEPIPYRNWSLLDFQKEFSAEELIKAYVSSEFITYAALVSSARAGMQR